LGYGSARGQVDDLPPVVLHGAVKNISCHVTEYSPVGTIAVYITEGIDVQQEHTTKVSVLSTQFRIIDIAMDKLKTWEVLGNSMSNMSVASMQESAQSR